MDIMLIWAAMRIRSSKSALVNMTTTSHFSFQPDDDDGEMEHTDGVYFYDNDQNYKRPKCVQHFMGMGAHF